MLKDVYYEILFIAFISSTFLATAVIVWQLSITGNMCWCRIVMFMNVKL